MRTLKTVCAISGLLTAVSTAALAQATSDNIAVIDQIGSDNSALIDQTGARNFAGADDRPMLQDGIYNDIDTAQTGTQNSIGLGADGVTQLGRLNTQDIFNRILIEQSGDSNVVGSIQQQSLGGVANGANTLEIRQTGADRNRVGAVRQIQQDGQAAQIATVSQTGPDNVVTVIEQLSNSAVDADRNTITVRMTGSNNGRIALSDYADIPITTDNGIIQSLGNEDQRSNGNYIDMLITGSDNRFGLRQQGLRNRADLITLNGDGNQLGLRQDGTENTFEMGPVDGNENNVGVDQMGTNTAYVNLNSALLPARGPALGGNGNRILLVQMGTNDINVTVQGNENDFTGLQDYDGATGGTRTTATASITGDQNVGRLTQRGENSFSLSITGSNNNNAGVFNYAGATGLLDGDFVQTGENNTTAVDVFGDSNLFAFIQNGDDNELLTSIIGSDNQSAVQQTGAQNFTDLRQSGKGNGALIRQ